MIYNYLSKMLKVSQLDKNLLNDDNIVSEDKILDDSLVIKNPFLINKPILIDNEYVSLINIKNNKIFKHFDTMYILCLKNRDVDINDFYKKNVSVKELNNLIQNFELVEFNLNLLNNKIHKSRVIYFESYYLNKFSDKFNFSEMILVLPLINIDINSLNLYLSQFDSDDEMNFFEYLNIKMVNNFYQNTDENLNLLVTKIKKIDVLWSKYINEFNITNEFQNRNLISSRDFKNKNIRSLNLSNSDYLSNIDDNKTRNFIDPSICINRYKGNFLCQQNSFFVENINNCIQNISTYYEVYMLSLILLTSEKYCYLVINNPTFLNLLNNFKSFNNNTNEVVYISLVETYLLSYQYAIGYTWLSLYINESLNKKYLTQNNKCIFTIDNASKLPSFPVHIENYVRFNPYLPILINENALNLKYNILGVEPNNKFRYGVVDYQTFLERFNIFATRNSKVNILENIDMNNLAITGSVIPACITKYNPLMDLHDTYERYLDEYYIGSDIDVMCNIQDDFKFIERIYIFYNQIKSNFKKYFDEDINIEPIKNIVIFINDDFIKKICKYTKKKVDLNSPEIKDVVYKYYCDKKLNDISKYINSEIWTNDIFNSYFDIVPINNLNILYKKDHFFEYNESIKFKLTSNLITTFEIFKIQYDDFISAVSQFHLSCVRGIFNGSQVLLTPSCISSAQTLVCFDIKYFASFTTSWKKIVAKYRGRGYSILLNNKEIDEFINYCYEDEHQRKLYNNFNKTTISLNRNLLGSLHIDSKIFKPRSILHTLYSKYKPVSFEYKKQSRSKKEVITLSMYANEIYRFCNESINVNNIENILNVMITPIGKNGTPNKINQSFWLFEYIYDIQHQLKDIEVN